MDDTDIRDNYAAGRLLASLIKGPLGPGLIDSLTRHGPDWDSVLEAAVKDGIFYPLYKNLLLSDASQMFIPADVRERFRQTYYLHIFHSSGFLRGIEQVLDRIESFKIRALVLKGLVTDSFIYDDFFRPRLDMDIVVRDEDAHSLGDVLRDMGYAALKDEEDCAIPEHINSRLFVAASDGLIPVHVHRHLINNLFLTVDNALSMDMEDVWEQTEPFKSYRYVCMLRPELNIVYLCEHGLKHDFDQLVYFYEMDRLIHFYNGRLDWGKLISLSEIFGLGRVVYYGLFFLKEMFSSGVPQEVILRLKPRSFSSGEDRFIRNVLAGRNTRYSSYPVYCALRKGLLKKADFMFRTVFPPKVTLKGHFIRIKRSLSSRSS